MQIIQLKVTGMHCGGCVKSVTRVLSELAGVQKVDVSLEQESAQITFDPQQVQPVALIEAIEDAGFDASL